MANKSNFSFDKFEDLIKSGLTKSKTYCTCWSHIFDLIAQTFRTSFPLVDKFVSNMKKTFNFKEKMCKYYRNSCNTMPPIPVITRWSSWLNAVRVHSKNFDNYKDIFESINKDKLGKSSAFKKCQKLLDNNSLRAQLDFINAIVDTIIINIKRTEEMNCNIHYIHNDAYNL